MKKFIFILSAVATFSACSLSPAATPTASPTPSAQTSDQSNSGLSQIAAAIQGGQSAQCTMTKKDGTLTMNYEIKGKKMKMMSQSTDPKQKPGNMLSDGQFMYTWTDADKKGVKIAVPSADDLKKMAQQYGQQVPDFTSQDTEQKYQDMGYTINCKVAAVDDSDFVPPSDVTFTDVGAMMKNAGQTVQNAAQGMTKEQQDAIKQKAQQMMQQYQK